LQIDHFKKKKKKKKKYVKKKKKKKKKKQRKKVKSKTNTDENITWTVGLTLMSLALTFSSPKKILHSNFFLKKKKNQRERTVGLN